MADVKKTIEIIFGAVDQTAGGIGSVASNIDSLSDNLSKVTGPLADMGDFALKAEAAIVGLGLALIGVSVNEAAKFQAAQNEIGTLLTANSEQAGAFGRDILAYAADSTQAIDQITAATYAAISAGSSQADALGMVSQAEKLAVAGKAELTATTIALASTLNAYGESADQASRYSDVLFTTVKLGQTTIPELAAGLSQVTLLASSGKVPIETLGAAIAALTAKGAATPEALTAIKAALQAMLAPTEGAQKEAERLGIEFDATALKTKGFEVVLKEVMAATGGSEAALTKLFGSSEAVKGVLGLAAEGGARFEAALEAMRSAAGATQAAFDLMSSNASLAFQNMQSNLQIALITAGLPMLEQFGGSVKGLAEIFKALAKSIDAGAFEPLYKGLGEATKGLEIFLNGVAKALPEALDGVDFTGLAQSFGDVGSALGGIFGDLDLTKPDDLKRAIQFVVDSVESLNKVVQGIVTAWGPALATMVEAAAKFNGLSDGAKIATGEAFGFSQIFESTLKPIIGTVTGMVEGLTGAVTLLAAAMGGSALVNATRLIGSGGAGGAAGMLGMAAAASYGAVEIVKLALNLGEWAEAALAARRATDDSADTTQRLADRYAELTKATGLQIRSTEEFNAAVKSGELVWDDTVTAWVKADDAAKDLTAGLDGVAGAVEKVSNGPVTDYVDAFGNVIKTTVESGDALDKWNKALLENGGVIEDTTESTDKLTKATGELVIDSRKIIPIYDEATGKITGYKQNLVASASESNNLAKGQDAAGKSIKDVVSETEKAMEATRRWNEEVAKMNHAETLAIIEAQSAISTAKIEADAKKTVAAFESISASVQSTGETLVGLFDVLSGGNLGTLQGWMLEDEIKRESSRRDELIKAQINLIDAQVKEMEARTAALQRGDAMISIQGDGLAPHLEAFMWEILRAIQVRVNQDGYEMLLGA